LWWPTRQERRLSAAGTDLALPGKRLRRRIAEWSRLGKDHGAAPRTLFLRAFAPEQP